MRAYNYRVKIPARKNSIDFLIILMTLIISITIRANTQGSLAAFPGEGSNSSISWINYRLTNGSLIQDPTGDVSPTATDVVFSNPGDPSSVAYAFDGINAFFRLQIGEDPISNGSINASFGAYVAELAAFDAVGEQDFRVLVGVDGKSTTDRIYITNQDGSITNTVYSGSGFRSLPVPGSSPQTYYLDWQVPISSIAAIWPGFNSTTPLKMFFGTSTTLQSIVKDYMAGTVVDFRIVSLTELESAGNSTLPVELVSFEAEYFAEKIYLRWKTATELNNFGFYVQRRVIGNGLAYEWEEVGFIEGAGNSNSPKEYNFTDYYYRNDNLQYRLKQVDRNGMFEYSDEIEIHFDSYAEKASLQNYPNPFNPATTIEYNIPADIGGSFNNKDGISQQRVTLKVYDILGREVATLVNEIQPPGRYFVDFNAGQLSSGVYIYMLQTSSGFTLSEKLMFAK